MDLPTKQPLARRAFSSLTSETAGLVVSLGALGVMRGLAPDQLDKVKDVIAKKLILPWMDKARPWRDMMRDKCEAKGNDVHPVCDKLMNPSPENEAWLQANKPDITREDRARERANELVDFGVMLLPRLLTRLPLQQWTDKKLGLDPVDMKKYAFAQVSDTLVGGAALLGMTTIGHEQTRSMRTSLSGALRKYGVSREMATSITNFVTYAQVPGVAGNIANAIVLNSMGKKLAEQQNGDRDTQSPAR